MGWQQRSGREQPCTTACSRPRWLAGVQANTQAMHTQAMHTQAMHTQAMHTQAMHTQAMRTQAMHTQALHTVQPGVSHSTARGKCTQAAQGEARAHCGLWPSSSGAAR